MIRDLFMTTGKFFCVLLLLGQGVSAGTDEALVAQLALVPPNPVAEDPAKSMVSEKQSRDLLEIVRSMEQRERWFFQVFALATYFYVFFMGATIGSFLNVVIYRAPRGEDLIVRGSHCPCCGHRIRPRDNIPILGWLILRGRCRDCQSEIPPRYLFVELLTGLVFLGLFFLEVVSTGVNLPGMQETRLGGVAFTVWEWDWKLLGIWAYHCAWACLLICFALIQYDGQRIPPVVAGTAAFVGWLPALLAPDLRPLALWEPKPDWLHGISRGFADGLLGGIVGGIFGAIWDVSKRTRDAIRRWRYTALFSLTGIFLGWQAAVSVSLLLVPFIVVIRLLAPVRPGVQDAIMPMASAVHIAAWSWLLRIPVWPGRETSFLATTGGITLAAVLAAVGSRLHARIDDSSPTPEKELSAGDTSAISSPVAPENF